MARAGKNTGARQSATGRSERGSSGTARFHGEEGRSRVEDEIARDKQRRTNRRSIQPFRVWVRPGEATEIVILDDEPNFFMYEHNLKDPANQNRWTKFLGCVKESEVCPVCEATGQESYYAMVFSAIDFTEFKTKDGTVHEFSRKLMIVKPSQQKKFIRRFETEGTLRGARFELIRDKDTDPAIGNDIEFIGFMDEDELVEHEREWRDREGKVHVEKCYEVYDYDALFPEPTVETLRAEVGAGHTPGSRAQAEEELNGRRGSGGRSRGRESTDVDTEEQDRSWKRGRKSQDDDPDQDDDSAEDDDYVDLDDADDADDADDSEAPERNTRKTSGTSSRAKPSRGGKDASKDASKSSATRRGRR